MPKFSKEKKRKKQILIRWRILMDKKIGEAFVICCSCLRKMLLDVTVMVVKFCKAA